MVEILNIDRLILFVIFFIPGFISIKVYDLMIPGERRNFSDSLFQVIAYSIFNFVLLSWLIYIIYSENIFETSKLLFIALVFIILFIFPVFLPIIFLKVSKLEFIARYIIHPIQKPWDFVFGKRRAYWVIVHLKDGRRIGGRFDTESFASSFPAKEQIYLQEVWELDEKGEFKNPVERTNGIIILGDEMSLIEFFE